MSEFLTLSRAVEAASFAEMRLFMSGRPVEHADALARLNAAKARFDAHLRAMPRGRA